MRLRDYLVRHLPHAQEGNDDFTVLYYKPIEDKTVKTTIENYFKENGQTVEWNDGPIKNNGSIKKNEGVVGHLSFLNIPLGDGAPSSIWVFVKWK